MEEEEGVHSVNATTARASPIPAEAMRSGLETKEAAELAVGV